MITNEEQAAILSGRAWWIKEGITNQIYEIALDMAQWKDEQFKEYVKSKFLKCENNTANVPLKAGLFDEIIKEILNVEL